MSLLTRIRCGPAAGAVLMLALSGCGDRRVLLGVDALSFMRPAERTVAFGPMPALPVRIETGEVPVVDDLHVGMLGGAGDVVAVDDVTLTFSAEAADSTGSGLDTLRVYMSDAGTAPLSTPPVLVVPVTLDPGVSVPVHAVIGGDPRVRALFMQQEMRLSVTTSLVGPASGPPLNGRVTLTELRAAVVARRRAL